MRRGRTLSKQLFGRRVRLVDVVDFVTKEISFGSGACIAVVELFINKHVSKRVTVERVRRTIKEWDAFRR